MEGVNKETKITSAEKERVKDPRRVEQGKKLAAISREAKERKARERHQQETEAESKSESFNPYMVIISMVGVTLGGYYLLYLHRSNNKEDRREEPPEEEEPEKKSRLEKL